MRLLEGTEPAAAESTIRDIENAIEAQLPNRETVLNAARIKAKYPLSYADAFAAATAVQHKAPLWTGDPELIVADSAWVTFNPGDAS